MSEVYNHETLRQKNEWNNISVISIIFHCFLSFLIYFYFSSEVIRNDTLKSQRHTIPKECRQQIRAQLFQQRENIDFDPKLKTACKTEIKEICSTAQHGAGQVNTENASAVWHFFHLK